MCPIKSVDSKDIQGKQNKHNSKIRKSRDMNGNIKNCNWWGWAGEIAFCVHECIPWGMLQAGGHNCTEPCWKIKTRCQKHQLKIWHHRMYKFLSINSRNNFILKGSLWWAFYRTHASKELRYWIKQAWVHIPELQTYPPHAFNPQFSPVKWSECVIDVKGFVPWGLNK